MAKIEKEDREFIVEQMLREKELNRLRIGPCPLLVPRGPKPFQVTPEILDKIYELVMNGAEYDLEIYPHLNIGKDAWYRAKKNHPIIEEIIAFGKSNLINEAKGVINKALRDPKNRNHFDAAKFSVLRRDKLDGNNKVTINHTGQITTMSVTELDNALDALENDDGR